MDRSLSNNVFSVLAQVRPVVRARREVEAESTRYQVALSKPPPYSWPVRGPKRKTGQNLVLYNRKVIETNLLRAYAPTQLPVLNAKLARLDAKRDEILRPLVDARARRIELERIPIEPHIQLFLEAVARWWTERH